MSFFNFSRDEQQQQRDSGGVRQRPFVNTSLTAGAGQPNANFTRNSTQIRTILVSLKGAVLCIFMYKIGSHKVAFPPKISS